MAVWAGVDVGGRRKGFHVAVIDDRRLRAGPVRKQTVRQVVDWLQWHAPHLVAVDSPCAPAPEGWLSREEEREVFRRICGIRYTPALTALKKNVKYYEWILRGLDLYRALDAAGLRAIECFPTASFTRWAGPRGTRSRAAWTREAVAGFAVTGIPERLNQDGRDAIAAALTARAHSLDQTESLGAIVVPL